MSAQAPINTALADYSTIETLTEKYQGVFTEHQLRWAIRNRNINGLAKAKVLSKFGKRWLINERAFARWLSEQAAETT